MGGGEWEARELWDTEHHCSIATCCIRGQLNMYWKCDMATFVLCLRDCPSCLTARDLTVGSGWCTPRTSVPLEPGRTYTGQQTHTQIVC